MSSRQNVRHAQQWQLAERQRYLAELQSLGDRLRADTDRLRDEIEQLGGADAVPTNPRLDPLFVRPLLERREKLMRSIAEIDAQIIEAQAAVTAAQQEAALLGGALLHRGVKFEDRVTRRVRRSI
jgi:hypothetical protein